MSARLDWTSEILDFLSWRGRLVFDQSWPATSIPELAQSLGAADWETLILTNVLASPDFGRDVRRLIYLSGREMEQDRNDSIRVTYGRIRGKIQTRRTMLERVRSGRPVVWVTKQSSKEWQTEANRAVVGLLVYASRGSARIQQSLGSSIPATILDNLATVELALRSRPFRFVDPDPFWASRILPAALTSKSEFYRIGAKWITAVKRARRSRDAEDLRYVLSGGWLTAADDDKLFELYALSQIVRVLHGFAQWDEFKLNSDDMLKASSFSAVARQGDFRVQVRFDTAPSDVGNYAWVMDRYHGIDGRSRRPDFIISSETSKAKCTTFIEAKSTVPNGRYGRDSIVKVLGYLKDYETLWSSEIRCAYPRCVLLYASGVVPTASSYERFQSDELVLSDTNSFANDLREIFVRHSEIAQD